MKMDKVEIECGECEAVCKVVYDLDDMFFSVKYCPFCGYLIEKDDIIEDVDGDDDIHESEDDNFYRDEDEDHF